MSLLAPAPADPDAPLSRRNPAAKLTAAAVVMAGLVVSADIVTPGLVLLAELVVLPLAGLGLVGLWRRAWPLLLGVTGIAMSNLLFAADPRGRVLLDAGPLTVTTGSASSTAAVALRLLAVALPGILVAATTDPVDLADSLVQQWRTPPRFAYGALAALRLLPLLGQEWRTIAMARRARGIDAGRSPVAAVRLFSGQVFALLVVAIRRAVRLAAAMDGRGFAAGGPRTYARVQRVTRADLGLVAASTAVVAGALAVSVAAGTWQLILS